MPGKVTIIMYHYVRDLKGRQFSGLKALPLDSFRRQLRYILDTYSVIPMEQVLDAVSGQGNMPDNAALLTFDDGFIDHFTNVYPLLMKNRVRAAFFPSTAPLVHGVVLDVHKIHFILASHPDMLKLLDETRELIDASSKEYALKDTGHYFRDTGSHGRFDAREPAILKRALQRELPLRLRQHIVDILFRKYVTKDEIEFSKKLYMSKGQLQAMLKDGMYIGNHGHSHIWLGDCDTGTQQEEISTARRILGEIGCPQDRWVMCYPYGSYSDSLTGMLKENACAAGLTTEPRIACPGTDNPLILPRMDTNDIKAA
ncbi:MAG: polysaccharide deacetylase family protein [Candidatus Omnitrophota bacterium]